MSVPFSYILRNVAARRLTTALTAGGMALVVYVFATVLMLAAGLEQTLVATGQNDNVVVPTWRARDVTREIDVIEEIARFRLEDVPFTLPARRAFGTDAGQARPRTSLRPCCLPVSD